MNKQNTIFRVVTIISVLCVGFLSVYSAFSIIRQPKVHYIKSLPGNMLATTIPPFGIYIKEKYVDEGDGPGTILAHERIHWLQY